MMYSVIYQPPCCKIVIIKSCRKYVFPSFRIQIFTFPTERIFSVITPQTQIMNCRIHVTQTYLTKAWILNVL